MKKSHLNISLCGFMGAGKSTMGKYLSDKFNKKFIDLDTYIENKYQLKISDLFAKGEDYFRDLESICLNKIFNTETNFVLALGGGTVCFNNNLQLVKHYSTLIYIRCDINTLTERLWHERHNRPLIKNISTKKDLSTYITQKLSEREAFYQQADITSNSIEEVFSAIQIGN